MQAVFFDVGFTLLFADPGEVDIAHTACADRGHAVPRECLEQHAPAASTALRRLAKANPDTWSDERAIQAAWISFFTHLIRPCLAGVPARDQGTSRAASLVRWGSPGGSSMPRLRIRAGWR